MPPTTPEAVEAIEALMLERGIPADLYNIKSLEQCTGFVCSNGETHVPAYTCDIEFLTTGVCLKAVLNMRLWEMFGCSKKVAEDADLYRIQFDYGLGFDLALLAGCDQRSLNMRREIAELKLQIEALELSPYPGKKYIGAQEHFDEMAKK